MCFPKKEIDVLMMFSCNTCDERPECKLKVARLCKKAREINRNLQKGQSPSGSAIKTSEFITRDFGIKDKLKTI